MPTLSILGDSKEKYASYLEAKSFPSFFVTSSFSYKSALFPTIPKVIFPKSKFS